MSYFLADTTGYLDDFASIGGLRDFYDWAQRLGGPIAELAREGFTEQPKALVAALEGVAVPPAVQPQVAVLRQRAPTAKDVLIISDGTSEGDDLRVAFDPSQPRDEQGQWTSGGGSGLGTDALGQVFEPNGQWNEASTGEKPYGWLRPGGENYTVPTITHKVVRDGGIWGSSHGNSQMMTGAAAEMMGIPGYRGRGQIDDQAKGYVTNFLTHIASDETGSEEPLHHSFENVRKTDFKVGDTLRLPLTATAGDVGSYGVRLDAESQSGQPVVFEFAKGTQMVAYSNSMTAKDAKDMGYPSLDAALKDVGHVWSEALVAGGFKVTGVRTEYMGSQHGRGSWEPDGVIEPDGVHQIYGKVVQLTQTETWDPKTGWKKRG